MARSSSVESCMICGNLPCTCFAKPKKVAAPRPKKAASAPVVDVAQTGNNQDTMPPEPFIDRESTPPSTLTRQSMVDRMRARAVQAPPKLAPAQPVRAKPVVQKHPEPPEEDAALVAAVRILNDAFVIEPDDLAPFRKYLDVEPSLRERASFWKARKNSEEEGGTDRA